MIRGKRLNIFLPNNYYSRSECLKGWYRQKFLWHVKTFWMSAWRSNLQVLGPHTERQDYPKELYLHWHEHSGSNDPCLRCNSKAEANRTGLLLSIIALLSYITNNTAQTLIPWKSETNVIKFNFQSGHSTRWCPSLQFLRTVFPILHPKQQRDQRHFCRLIYKGNTH